MKSVRLLSKPQYHLEEDSEGSWAISYGDMITLLLSFFVIFFTTDFKKEKVEKLNRLLSFELEGVKEEVAPKTGHKKNDMPLIEGFEMQAHPVDENVIVTFNGKSFFQSGSVTPNEVGERLIKEFVSKYLPYAGNYRISIKAFTDSKPVSKTKVRVKPFSDNLELSALRAIATMRVLQKAGIPLNRMEIAGAGELEKIESILPRVEGLTKKELEAFSRTVVLVISPLKESWL